MSGGDVLALERRIHKERHVLRHPNTDWMTERHGPDGAALLES